MAATENYLAFDLGASSGRAILGSFDGSRLAIEPLHRFPNGGVRVLDSLHWDVLRLFDEMKQGLRAAAPHRPRSLGVDTWGVDFALLDAAGVLLGNPYHYRDRRTQGVMLKVLKEIPREWIYERTGLQFMEINTLYQLVSMKGSPALEAARTLLMMPDLFHYWFTGEAVCEFTDATTTQFYDPRKKAWARDVLERLGLPQEILPSIVPPGTRLGALRESVARGCGVDSVEVAAPATHDTGSAVAAVPAGEGDWAFLSSGTWSLLGAEVPGPFVTAAALERNFTNEGGVWGTTRLLKNICGMWLLEECRRIWALRGQEVAYAELLEQASQAEAFRSLVDVDDPEFLAPAEMPKALADYCRRSAQPVPAAPGEFARCIFESLALKYRLVLEDLETITGSRRRTLHIVGGGSQNEMLSQFAADATGAAVIAGPAEATAIGNVLLQMAAMGRISSSAEAREIVRNSFLPKRYEPGGKAVWGEAAERLKRLLPR